MTLNVELTKVTRVGDGVATSFSFSPIPITAASDLVVTHFDANDVEIGTLVFGVDYNVVVPSYPGTGSITYPVSGGLLPAGESLVIQRVLPLTQDTRLRNQGGYFPEVQERTFDRLAMQIQQMQEQIDRAFTVPVLGFDGLAGAVPRVNATEDGIEYALGLTGSPGADGVAGPAGPVGPAVQHVHTIDTTTKSTAGNTFVDTGISVTITPKSASHRVRVRVSSIYGSSSATGALYLTLFRGAVDLTPAGRDGMTAIANQSALPVQIGFEFVDSPATTSATVYHLFFKGNASGTQYLGGRADAFFDAMTTMVAEEIRDDGTTAPSSYIIPEFIPGIPTASEIMLRHVVTAAVSFPADFAGSKASASAAATASTVFTVRKNAVNIGTITFAAAGSTGAFSSSGAAVSLAAGDVLDVIAPASPDATLANIAFTFAGQNGS